MAGGAAGMVKTRSALCVLAPVCITMCLLRCPAMPLVRCMCVVCVVQCVWCLLVLVRCAETVPLLCSLRRCNIPSECSLCQTTLIPPTDATIGSTISVQFGEVVMDSGCGAAWWWLLTGQWSASDASSAACLVAPTPHQCPNQPNKPHIYSTIASLVTPPTTRPTLNPASY